MSFADHAAAQRVKGLRGITRAVFLEIASRTSRDDQHECSVKVRTLAEAIGRSEKAVRVAIQEIRGVGLVHTIRRARRNGTRSCFKFKLVTPFPHEVVVPKKPPKNQKPAVNGTAQPAVNGTVLLSGSSLLDQGSIGIKKPEATPSKTPGIADVPSSLQEPENDKDQEENKNLPKVALKGSLQPHELRKLWEAHVDLDVPEGAAWGMFKTLAAADYDIGPVLVQALCDWDGFVQRAGAKISAYPKPSLGFVVRNRGTLWMMHQYNLAYACADKVKAEAEAAYAAKVKAQAVTLIA
jgi:hypothetical protein